MSSSLQQRFINVKIYQPNPPSDEAMNETTSQNQKRHDAFNLLALPVICLLNVIYLTAATKWSNIGTDRLGIENQDSAQVLLTAFTLYLIVDLIWVMLFPDCVARDPASIIVHHLVCLIGMTIPWTERQFTWHLAVNCLVEINTFFLTLRRNVDVASTLYRISNTLFYITWVVFRLFMFPCMVVFVWLEYLRYSEATGTTINMLAFACVGQAFITAMSFNWTIDLLVKLYRARSSVEKAK